MWRAQGNVVTRGEGLQIPLKKLSEFEAELYKSSEKRQWLWIGAMAISQNANQKFGRNPGRKQMRKEALMNENNVLQSL